MILSHIYLLLGSVISICALSTVSGPEASMTNHANVSRHQMYISEDEVGPFKKVNCPFLTGLVAALGHVNRGTSFVLSYRR